MDFKRGLVVKNKAGHERNQFFVVLECNDSYAYISDGRHRKLENLKKKNLKHLFVTNKILPEEFLTTNRKIREALREYNRDISQHN